MIFYYGSYFHSMNPTCSLHGSEELLAGPVSRQGEVRDGSALAGPELIPAGYGRIHRPGSAHHRILQQLRLGPVRCDLKISYGIFTQFECGIDFSMYTYYILYLYVTLLNIAYLHTSVGNSRDSSPMVAAIISSSDFDTQFTCHIQYDHRYY